jgi:UDP-glucose 4-epimerase
VAGERVRIGTRRPADSPEWLGSGEVVPFDLTKPAAFAAACDGSAAVIHLAAPNEIESARDPERALDLTAGATLRLLAAAESAGVKRFVYLSTAHIYGSPLAGEIDEDTLPRPVHPYAISHRAAEDFVLAALRRGAFGAAVVRLSNAIGAPERPDVDRWTLVGNDLCRQAVTHRTIRLHSSGLQRRDFIALPDVTAAIHHLLTIPESFLGDGLFNLGGECPLRIVDVAERVAKRCRTVLGFEPPILRPDPRSDESSATLRYSIEKLRATGFAPTASIDEELDATLQLCARAFHPSTG